MSYHSPETLGYMSQAPSVEANSSKPDILLSHVEMRYLSPATELANHHWMLKVLCVHTANTFASIEPHFSRDSTATKAILSYFICLHVYPSNVRV